MRMALTLLALGLCPLTTGCRLAVNAARNLAYEPMRYTDDAVECYRNHRLACEAWDHVAEANGGKAFSRDYRRGFKDGYADYLRNQGTGMPPPVPPKCYWNQHYQTPEGHAAIEDWYAGFAHGAQAAREGWRAPFLTVPTHAEGPDAVRAAIHDAADGPAPAAAEIPPPRPVKEAPAEPLRKEPKVPLPKPLPEAPQAGALVPLPTLRSPEPGIPPTPAPVIPRPPERTP